MTHQIFTILVQFNDQSSREVQIKDIDHKLIPVHLTSLFGANIKEASMVAVTPAPPLVIEHLAEGWPRKEFQQLWNK